MNCLLHCQQQKKKYALKCSGITLESLAKVFGEVSKSISGPDTNKWFIVAHFSLCGPMVIDYVVFLTILYS